MPLFTLRAPCSCGSETGYLTPKNGQQCAYCSDCGAYQYNAPKTETGERTRSVSTTHAAIKPRLRVRILQRATGRCELCGARKHLHVGHILSVEAGFKLDLTDAEINSEANLAALCEECNLGLGKLPIEPRVYVALLKERL